MIVDLRTAKSLLNRRQRGGILLFALLIMASVILGSMGISSIILDMLQQTRISDNSVLAYYAAETGIEETLYHARKTGLLPPSRDASSPQVLVNDSQWWSDVAGTTAVIYDNIDRDEFTEINLFDPDFPANFSRSNISRVNVRWSGPPASVLRASVASWWPGAQVGWTDEAARLDVPFEYVGGNADIIVGPPPKLYKLRLRAKHASLEDVTIKAYDDADVLQQLPGQVVINATGRMVDAQRRLRATMTRGAPLSGIFEFVIFSECSLVKGGRPISCP